MSNKVRYQGSTPSHELSPALWDNPHVDIMSAIQYNQGMFFKDDFENTPTITAADTDTDKYSYYSDTGVIHAQSTTITAADDDFGVLEVTDNDADNDEGHIAAHGVQVLMSSTAGARATICFECCLKKASIADNALAMFIGIAEEGLAAAETLLDTSGSLADKDFFGFHVDHAAGEACDATYELAGQTAQVNIAGVHTFVADTYVKLGFRYQPWAIAAERVAWFVNGVEQSTYVTNAQFTAATSPDGQEMGLLWATKVGTAAESKAQLDWWALYSSPTTA